MTKIFKALEVPKKFSCQFSSLCLDPNDSLLLKDFQNSTEHDLVILIERNGKVLCWAHVNTWENQSDVVTFQCFVSLRHRRKGYGSQLYQTTKEIFKDKRIGRFPHNSTSKKFFKKMELIHGGL